MTFGWGCPIVVFVELHPYQICRSNDGWVPVKVNSSSDPSRIYRVYVNPWGQEHENICECRGYVYTGHCKHQAMAAELICGWSELDCEEVQNDFERHARQCPRCGGPTKIEVEIE